MVGVERAFDTRIFEGNVWGLQWFTNDIASKGLFPQDDKHVGEERVAVPTAGVPTETKLLAQEFNPIVTRQAAAIKPAGSPE